MSRMPVVRQISWLATLPQIAALATAIAIGAWATGNRHGVALGAACYLAYSFGSRIYVPRAHWRGTRLLLMEQYEEAIRAFQASYEFFTRNAWIDRFRAVVLMTPSAISYREMALCNIAFCHSQLGDGASARHYYQRTLDEFPDSALAMAGLRMLDSARTIDEQAS